MSKQHLSRIIEFEIHVLHIQCNKNGLPKCLHPVFGIIEANEHVCIVSKGKK